MAAFPSATLAIAGTGELDGALRAQIETLGLQASVALLGRISEEELVRRYQQAHLVVLPTQELEGFGLTTAEALACGTPVLGTPAGATPELLAPIDPALVAAGTASSEIADSALALLSDRERLEQLASQSGPESRQEWAGRPSWLGTSRCTRRLAAGVVPAGKGGRCETLHRRVPRAGRVR